MPRETERVGSAGGRDREQARERACADDPEPRGGAAGVLWLQGGAGNRAVAAHLARAPAGDAPPAAAPSGPPAPGQARVVDPPPPQQGVDSGEKLTNVDLGSEARQVTLTFLIGRDFHLKGRDAATIDWLHEPGVTVKATQGRVPKPVIEAAVAAMNIHIRSHGKDLVEVALSPQAGVSHEGTPSAGGQLQVEVAVTSTFSISAATALGVSPRTEGPPEEGSVPLLPPSSSVDLSWSPMSIAATFKLPEPGTPGARGERDKDHDYRRDMEDGKVGAWVAAQISRAELGPDIEPTTVVDELVTAMRATTGPNAQYTMHLGEMEGADLPPGLVRALTRAANLVVQAKPSLSHLSTVSVNMLHYPKGSRQETSLRWVTLGLESETILSNAPAPPPPPLRTWGAPD
jgi:hypothetical protein